MYLTVLWIERWPRYACNANWEVGAHQNEGRLQINAGYRIHDKGADLNSWRNTPPYNIRFYHSAYRRVAPHAIAPMAEIRQKVCAALVLAQKLKRPICWWRPLVKFA